MISLGGGMPNPATFPFSELSVTLEGGESFQLGDDKLGEALQYSATNGLPGFLAHLDSLRASYHGPQTDADAAAESVPRASMVSTGSQDALSKAFEMLLGPGDSLLVESPTYSGSLAFLRPLGRQLCGVQTDGGGLVPEALDELLDGWDQVGAGRRTGREAPQNWEESAWLFVPVTAALPFSFCLLEYGAQAPRALHHSKRQQSHRREFERGPTPPHLRNRYVVAPRSRALVCSSP